MKAIDNPDIMRHWDYARNDANNINPSKLTAGSGRTAFFIDDYGHTWTARICEHTGCPYCTGKKVLPGFNDLESCYPEIASEFASDLNDNMQPCMIQCKSSKKYYWRCVNNHTWKQSVAVRTINGNKCPYCSNRKVLPGFNDLLTHHPVIKEYWSDRNDKQPNEIMHSNHMKIWLHDSCGHEWSCDTRRINNLGVKCPYCNNELLLTGFNDLQSKMPALLADWNYDMNAIMPSDILVNSSKRIHWRCHECGHEWSCNLCNRTRIINPSGCPKCARNQVSKQEDDLYEDLMTIAGSDSIRRNRRILRLKDNDGNYVSNKLSEIDFIINDRMAIEYNGDYWHSDEIIRRNKHGFNNAHDYHEAKMKAASELGLVLVFIWEHDYIIRHEDVMLALHDYINSDGMIIDMNLLKRLSNGIE